VYVVSIIVSPDNRGMAMIVANVVAIQIMLSHATGQHMQAAVMKLVCTAFR
jgi:hypothetical protein